MFEVYENEVWSYEPNNMIYVTIGDNSVPSSHGIIVLPSAWLSMIPYSDIIQTIINIILLMMNGSFWLGYSLRGNSVHYHLKIWDHGDDLVTGPVDMNVG